MNDNKIIKFNDGMLKKGMFPLEPNINYTNLLMTSEGMYSITHSHYAEQITNFIKNSLGNTFNTKDLIITDATSNVGGNTLNFSKHFKSVNAIELSSINCHVLKNNIKVYNRNNVNIICSDFLEIVKDLEQDIIFMDPPWGGPDYKKKDKIVLKLSDTKISSIIDECFKNKYATTIVIKVPSNVDFNEIIRSIYFKKFEFFKIKNYGLIIIKNIMV
jgi:16S rRNA G966 N2-methylase RsmD